MGTLGSAAALEDGDREEEDKRRDTERLPPLLEDEENVSLADVLCLRDGVVSEQELWAVCVECVCSLQSIVLSPLFHSLVVTPDTLAFNSHGNVCFMEQLNDDPEGCFVPPEFDKTGSTFEGHVFSLGSTLWAALEFVTDADPKLELSEESLCLLKQMQRETPEDRPALQVILSQAKAVLDGVSPTAVCRKLSAIGRRVLSIESLAALPDGWEKSELQFLDNKALRWSSVETHSVDRVMSRLCSSDSCDGEDLLQRRRALLCNGTSWSGGSVGGGEDEPCRDSRSQNSSPERRRSQERARRALNRSCSVPDYNNPPALDTPVHTPISMMMTDLSHISPEPAPWRSRLSRGGPREEAGVPSADTSVCVCETGVPSADTCVSTCEAGIPSVDTSVCVCEADPCETDQSITVDNQSPDGLEDEDAHADPCRSSNVSRTMMCLNDEPLSQWISLRDLLSRSARPFSVPELWALCYTCLSTLQTYIDLPDFLCLDSVFVGCEGEVLFLRPKNSGSCDSFFLAPEFQEHGIVTEKACVYGVAAILWATAKFHLSPDQKLAMPRRLKRLLLEMAKRTPIERPSIETARKVCREYLSRQGMSAESVWTQIINRVHQALDGGRSSPACDEHASEPQTGFVPLASEARLEPVNGPLHLHYPQSSSFSLPEAFTSPATHFSPIILSTHTEPMKDATDEPEKQEGDAAEDCGMEEVFPRVAGHSSSSGSQTLLNSPQTPLNQPKPSAPHANGTCDNFLLQRDPQTGHLTILPVQIRLQPITGLHQFSVNPERTDPHTPTHNGGLDNDEGLVLQREASSAVVWEKELQRLINQRVCGDPSSSDPVGRAAASLPSPRRASHLDHNANLCSSAASDRDQVKTEPELTLGEHKHREMVDEDAQEVTSQDDRREAACALTEAQCCVSPAGGAGELDESAEGHHLTPDGSERDMDDCDSLISVCSLRGSSWALALHGHDCFAQDVLEYVQKLCAHSEAPTLEDRAQELHQQLIIESRNLKKTRTFYHKLIQQERKNKVSDSKLMVSKVKQQFDELRAKVEFLQTVKKYLQVLSVDRWGLPLSLLPSLAASGSAPLDLQPCDDPAVLQLVCEQRRGSECPLVSASARGLMAYLYARNAHCEGFIQQFFYTYSYVCSSRELLQFLMDKFTSTVGMNDDPSSDAAKVYQRTLDLLHFCMSDAQILDFSGDSGLRETLHAFLSTEVAPVDSRGESLLAMLQDTPRKRRVYSGSCDISLEDEEGQSVCRKSSFEDGARKWRVVEPQILPTPEPFSIGAALPRPYAALSGQDRLCFSRSEHTPLLLAQQLTLMEQEIFQDCHPVHFLNSRAHGVAENTSRCVSVDSPPVGPLHTLLSYSDCVSHWVSAELVVCDSVKAQAAQLARFLSVAKLCYEWRNFSGAVQILTGLENVIVRQLPMQAWKQLPLKVCDVLDELKAVQVFLKSDGLCLTEGATLSARATLPHTLTLALHVQQMEIGAFRMTSGAYKWPKLRRIARVVGQIPAFQERLYPFAPDLELQSFLRGRITRFGRCDVTLLTSENTANFSPAAGDRHTRRVQDTMRRIRASLQ